MTVAASLPGPLVARALHEQLAAPFPPTDIEWRIQSAGKTEEGGPWAKCIAYITNRAIAERLDAVCGAGGWQNRFKEWGLGTPGVLCGIGIYVVREGDIDGQWVWKWDGAEQPKEKAEGQPVAVKGGFSAAMKRAGAQWGIGRYLYDLPEGWVKIVVKGTPLARYAKLKDHTAFYWLPPSLPTWALPDGGSERAAPRAAAPKRQDPPLQDHDDTGHDGDTAPIERPANAPPPEPGAREGPSAATDKQVAFYQRLCESSVFTEEERRRALEWLATKATRQTIKDQIDWLKRQVETRKAARGGGDT